MPDYIIVGQGICGSSLSYYLQKCGKKILVIDKPQLYTASKVASGVINPVTGRRIVKTWLVDVLLPFVVAAYGEFGERLQESLIRQCNVIDFFATPQMEVAFTQRANEESELLKVMNNINHQHTQFRFNYGMGEIHPCYLVDLQTLLSKWRLELKSDNALWEEEFDIQQLSLGNNEVRYKEVVAEKIIFCDGVAGEQNLYFNKLPFAFNKGEALIVRIPGLPQTNIYKQGINIVPWKEKDLFWIGSNYLWEYEDLQPTETFRKRTEEQLKYWLKLPFTVEDHIASERPANMERRPFVGLHPIYSSIGILNGMGTKGCSLAPYFAFQLTEHLLKNSPIEPLADVKRFSRILSR